MDVLQIIGIAGSIEDLSYLNDLGPQILSSFWPVLIVLVGALITLFTALLKSKQRLPISGYISAVTLIATLAAYFQLAVELESQATAVQVQMLLVDPYACFFGILLSFIALVTVLSSISYFDRQKEQIPEVFSLILFSVFGMLLMLHTQHLLVFFVALEIMSLAIYVLVAIRRSHAHSLESAMKYFVLGSVASAFLLMGIALIYGAMASFDLSLLVTQNIQTEFTGLLKIGVVLVLLGFVFKIGSVPFHFWTPDVYAGAPYPITGFMSVGVKVAAFAALLRVLVKFLDLPLTNAIVTQLLIIVAIATLILANLAALKQTNIKRILAYSSIAHAGYLLLGCVAYALKPESAPGYFALSSMLFYMVIYSLMTLGVFTLLSSLAKGDDEATELQDLAGLATRKPGVSACLALFLISLAGIPPLAGFFAKFYLLKDLLLVKSYGLLILALLLSAVSFYYYIAPVVYMYFKKGRGETVSWLSPLAFGLVTILAAFVLYLGVSPNNYLWLSRWAKMISL